jgi:hypothetical protein
MSCGGKARILISDPVEGVCAAYPQKHGYTVEQIKLSKEQLLDVVKVTKFDYNDEFWTKETDEFDGFGRNKLA